MKGRTLRSLCTAALLAAATLAQAEIDRPAAEGLVRKSGLWEQLGGIGLQVQAGMQQSLAGGTGLSPTGPERARVSRVIQAAYAPDRLRSVSTGVIAARMQPQHLQALRQWFDSPQGQAVTRAEEASLAGDADPGVTLKEGSALLKSMPAERRKLLEDLLAATRAAEAMVQITISTGIAVQLGAASAQPGAPSPSAAQLRGVLETQRPQMLQAFSAMSMASFAHAYAGIPTQELRQYVAFIRTPAGTAFNDAAMEALEAALTDAAAEMGRRLPGTRDGSNT
ncbi:MAG TPA: hypothetical protein VGD76_05960 [Ramlibacter sp.]